MRVFFALLLLCLSCLVPGQASAGAAPSKGSIDLNDEAGWHDFHSGQASAGAAPSEDYIDMKVGAGWPGFYPPPTMKFYVCPKWTAEEFLPDNPTWRHCRHSQIPDEPLPLVAYIIQDTSDKKEKHKSFPLYQGYLVLAEKEEGTRYVWSGKSAGYFPQYLFSGRDAPLRDACWYYFKGRRWHCEFAKMNTPASFFLWMKAMGVFEPHYRIFFTTGLPPDDAWTPEFDADSPVPAAADAALADAPDNRPRLKNPLPGMRPAPSYRQKPRVEASSKSTP